MKMILALLSASMLFLVGCVTTEPTKEDIKNDLIAEQVKLELVREMQKLNAPTYNVAPAYSPVLYRAPTYPIVYPYQAPTAPVCGCPTEPVAPQPCAPCASGQIFIEKQ